MLFLNCHFGKSLVGPPILLIFNIFITTYNHRMFDEAPFNFPKIQLNTILLSSKE